MTGAIPAIMQFMLTPDNSKATFEKEETTFADIQAYIYGLEAPKYPLPIDRSLAQTGEKLFNVTCAKCHGTYGANFWLNLTPAEGQFTMLPGGPESAFEASGNDGQFIVMHGQGVPLSEGAPPAPGSGWPGPGGGRERCEYGVHGIALLSSHGPAGAVPPGTRG